MAPEINVDFSSVQADEFSIVPPGDYDCTISIVKYDQRDSDTEETFPYLNFDLIIDEGQDYAGSHLFHIASFSPKGNDRAPVRRTKFLLLTLGVELSGPQKWNVDAATKKLLQPDLTGQPVSVRVVREKDRNTGEERARVSRIRGKTQVADSANGQPARAAAAQYK